MYYLFDFPRRLELDYDSLVSGHEAKLVAEDSSFGLKFSGSCNGLLCVFASPRTLALVNPSTRETKTILSDHDPNITHDFTFMHPIFGGFGYDPFNDDYKVVSIDGACFGLEPALSITALDLTKQEFSRIPTPFSSDVYGQLYAMGGNLCMGTVDYPQESYEFWEWESEEVNIGEIPTGYIKPLLSFGFSYMESLVALQTAACRARDNLR
ncbi:hypothetical protein V6N11_065616 [Hibiscus sabdariffa]|uniref:F-box associated beta-propeller type 3 domain-containing protein n=1 Tax=Hibiscus sabdariffa TaxID=183260 RepID=A0ABR2PHU6_9ROSI